MSDKLYKLMDWRNIEGVLYADIDNPKIVLGAKEVKEGYECGMSFENYNDIQVGDYIECYEIETIAAKL